MVDRSSFAPGAPCWADLTAPDLEAARRFYGAVLGWEFQDNGVEYGHYTMCLWKGRPVAALMPPPPSAEGMPTAWNVYLTTDDVERSSAEVTKLGGELVLPPHEVPRAGTLAYGTDPQGAVFGLWQPGGHTGAALYAEPGAISWVELTTTDGEAADAFYQGLFGYEQRQEGDGDAFDYTAWRPAGGGDPVCGRWLATGPDALAPGRGGPFWSVYFAVADVDVTARQVAALGGRVEREPADTPFGRVCRVSDPAGAPFVLITLPAYDAA